MVLALLLVSARAHALTCDEVMKMVSVHVPQDIIVQAIDEAGTTFSAEALACLDDRGAPPKVLAAAEGRAEAESVGRGRASPPDDDIFAPASSEADVGGFPEPIADPGPRSFRTHDWATLVGRADLVEIAGSIWASTVERHKVGEMDVTQARIYRFTALRVPEGAPETVLGDIATHVSATALVPLAGGAYLIYADAAVGSALVPLDAAGSAVWPAPASVALRIGKNAKGGTVDRGDAVDVVASLLSTGEIGAVTRFSSGTCEYARFTVADAGQLAPTRVPMVWDCGKQALSMGVADDAIIVAGGDAGRGDFVVRYLGPADPAPTIVARVIPRFGQIIRNASLRIAVSGRRALVLYDLNGMHVLQLNDLAKPQSNTYHIGATGGHGAIEVRGEAGFEVAAGERNAVEINELDRVSDRVFYQGFETGNKEAAETGLTVLSPTVWVNGNNGGMLGQDFTVAAVSIRQNGDWVALSVEKTIAPKVRLAVGARPRGAIYDLDEDGVPSAADQCPDFPGEKQGCPSAWWAGDEGALALSKLSETTGDGKVATMLSFSHPTAVVADWKGVREVDLLGEMRSTKQIFTPVGVARLGRGTDGDAPMAILEDGTAMLIGDDQTKVVAMAEPAIADRTKAGGGKELVQAGGLNGIPTRLIGAVNSNNGFVLTSRFVTSVNGFQRHVPGGTLDRLASGGSKSMVCAVSGAGQLLCDGGTTTAEEIAKACPDGVADAAIISDRLLLRCSTGEFKLRGSAGGWWPVKGATTPLPSTHWMNVCGHGGAGLVFTESAMYFLAGNAVTRTHLDVDAGRPLTCYGNATGQLVLVHTDGRWFRQSAVSLSSNPPAVVDPEAAGPIPAPPGPTRPNPGTYPASSTEWARARDIVTARCARQGSGCTGAIAAFAAVERGSTNQCNATLVVPSSTSEMAELSTWTCVEGWYANLKFLEGTWVVQEVWEKEWAN